MKAYNVAARKRQLEIEQQTREYLAKGRTIAVEPLTRRPVNLDSVRRRQWHRDDLSLEAYHREQ